MKQTQEQTAEQLPELSIEQQTILLREIRIYEDLLSQLEDTQADIDAMKMYLNKLRETFGDGAKKVSPKAGFFLTLVEGVSNSLDKRALMKAFGITPAQWKAHTKSKPKKAYLLITTPDLDAKAAAKKAAAPRDERDEEDGE